MSYRPLSFLVEGSDHIGDGYLPLDRHLHASPELPLTSQHLPHAWAMGGCVLMLGCYTDEGFGFPRGLQLQSLNSLFILAFKISNLSLIDAIRFI